MLQDSAGDGEWWRSVLANDCLSWQSQRNKADHPVDVGSGDIKRGRSGMRIISLATGLAVMLAAAAPSMAETLRSKVAFNTAIQKPAASQPAGGHAMTWDVKLSGGELDGCTASFAETLFPRDNMSWGIFQLEASVACDKGAFMFTSTGSWGKNGFHGAGVISEGGRSGEFSQAEGRVAMIDGTVVPAATAGTFDASYELIVERTDK
jgi:hypothetical protein